MPEFEGSVRNRAEAALDRVASLGVEATRIFIALDRERIRRDAERIDARVAAGESLPLAGVLCSIKDLIDRSGERTTAGSRLLERNEAATSDATIVDRLEAAGAVIFGRTNLTEFAYSGVGLNPHHGTPGCIFDVKNVPGGSSCGAALSVAHGIVDVAIGTDTGGSVRIPAALNGLYGIKPTSESIPTTGIHALSPLMDSVGPLGAEWTLTRRTLDVLRGNAQDASTHVPGRLGVPSGILTDALDPTVSACLARTLDQMAKSGFELVDLDMDWLTELPLANRTLIACDALDQYRDDLTELERIGDPHVLQRIRFAESINSETRDAALALRDASIARFSTTLAAADVTAIACPTVPIDTPTIARAQTDFDAVNASLLRNTSLINFVDGCALSLPVAIAERTPGALMLSAASGTDSTLLACADQVISALNCR